MGFSRSPLDLARKMERLNAEIASLPRSGIEGAAFLTKRLIVAEMHGVNRLSGVGKRGAKIGVRYDIKGVENAVALVRATGPFHLLERDTKPHYISPKRRNRSGFLGNEGRDFAAGATVSHPGSKGKHPFAKGVAAAEPVVVAQFRRSQTAALARVF